MSSTNNQSLTTAAETIDKKISEAEVKTNSLSSVCMYRVPKQLRKKKKNEYYTPHLVSIGPLHSEDTDLKPYMDIKMSYMNSLLCRVADGSKKTKLEVLEKCVEKMKELIGRAKECYAEEDAEKLNEEMLLIDGCFILELLFRSHCRSKENNTDPILDNNLRSVTVQQDLLLLENQLPFFVLQKLFKLTLAGIPEHDHSLDDYVLSFFPHVLSLKCDVDRSKATNCSSRSGETVKTNCSSTTGEYCVISFSGQGNSTCKKSVKIHHMLHFLHNYYIPNDLDQERDLESSRFQAPFDCFSRFRHQKQKEEREIEFMHSASDLDYAGVKFVAGTGKDLFKVKFTRDSVPLRWFHRACSEIPTLSIYDSTEVVLRNLIAFEQCCHAAPSYVTSYAFLMDRLINTAKDVEVLQKAKVICNYLGANEDASDLFNKLCKEIVLGKYYFAKTCKDAVAYSECRYPAAMAHVKRNYLASPWTFIAFCVAFIAFGATLGNFILNLRRKVGR